MHPPTSALLERELFTVTKPKSKSPTRVIALVLSAILAISGTSLVGAQAKPNDNTGTGKGTTNGSPSASDKGSTQGNGLTGAGGGGGGATGPKIVFVGEVSDATTFTTITATNVNGVYFFQNSVRSNSAYFYAYQTPLPGSFKTLTSFASADSLFIFFDRTYGTSPTCSAVTLWTTSPTASEAWNATTSIVGETSGGLVTETTTTATFTNADTIYWTLKNSCGGA